MSGRGIAGSGVGARWVAGQEVERQGAAERRSRTDSEGTMDSSGVDHDGSNLIEPGIGFRQFGVFGVVAVHTSVSDAVGCRPAMAPCRPRDR